MADTVFIFNKTLEQRIEEFEDVLCSGDVPVLASEVADQWSFCLENFIEPTGWQALWKISRQICEELNITFPKFVFVKVLRVDFRELTALVDVERVQDDITIPLKQDVPLTQLYPTKIQEEVHINVDYTANFIDQLRFFYNHIWCPWDVEDAEGGDWASKFLVNRVQLYFEMNDGTVPTKLADKIHKNKEQARKLFEQKQELEGNLSKGTVLDAEDISSPVAEEHTYKLMQVHLQLNPLITELQLFENPAMRKLIIKRFNEEEEMKRQNSNAVVVWQSGSVDSYIDFLSSCKQVLDEGTSIVSASSLLSAIESAVSGNTILLFKGIHYLNQILEYNLTITGIGSKSPEIVAKESNSFLFSVRNASIKLWNVHLYAGNVASVLQVSNNSAVELINCTITNEDAEDGRGIVVNPGGSVIIDGCNFSGLHVAVCCYPGSRVCIKNSNFKNCVFGVEAYESSELQISGGSVVNCSEAGIFISQKDGSHVRGGIEHLQKFPKISVSHLNLTENAVDVMLKTESN